MTLALLLALLLATPAAASYPLMPGDHFTHDQDAVYRIRPHTAVLEVIYTPPGSWDVRSVDITIRHLYVMIAQSTSSTAPTEIVKLDLTDYSNAESRAVTFGWNLVTHDGWIYWLAGRTNWAAWRVRQNNFQGPAEWVADIDQNVSDLTIRSVPGTPRCFDGRDNDKDGFRDFPADPECEDSVDHTEACGLLGIELLPVVAWALARRRRHGSV